MYFVRLVELEKNIYIFGQFDICQNHFNNVNCQNGEKIILKNLTVIESIRLSVIFSKPQRSEL